MHQMAWKDRWYGGNRSAAHRYLTNGLVLGAIAGAYGYSVNFVSSSLWWTAGSSLALGVTIVCLVAIVHGFKTGRLTSQPSISLPLRFGGLLGLAALVFCISWLLIVRAVPDTITRIVGVNAEFTVPLTAVYSRGTKSRRCEYRLEGEFLERAFPGRRCVSSSFAPFPSDVNITLQVKTTALGMHIVRFEQASANKRLQATRETRAPEA